MKGWFTNKGQLIQIALATLSCIFAGAKAWPDLKGNDFLSIGALLFYSIVLLLISLLFVVLFARQGQRAETSAKLVDHERITTYWKHCDRLLTAYRRLEYDHRHEVRFPFSHSSWPSFDTVWKYSDVQLYTLNHQVQLLFPEMKVVLGLYNWGDWSSSLIPEANEHTIIVDFLGRLQEFTAFLKTKIAHSGFEDTTT